MGIVILAFWTIKYSIDRDCNNPYNRDTGIGKYWIHIEMGSKKPQCTYPYKQSNDNMLP